MWANYAFLPATPVDAAATAGRPVEPRVRNPPGDVLRWAHGAPIMPVPVLQKLRRRLPGVGF